MMSNNLLEVKDLSVNVEEQQILRGINLNIGKGPNLFKTKDRTDYL